MAGEFALGGGDIVKDDHNLVDRSLDEFRERVGRCQDAVQAACARTRRVTLYLPYVCVPSEQLDEALGIVEALGIEGVLVAPMLLGLDTTRSLAARHPLLIMGHPTFTGGHYIGGDHGLEHGLVLGTLYRLAGVDVSVFTNFGGRFSFTRDQCIGIGTRLREPLGKLRPAFPAPAGGMRLDNIAQMCEDFGRDSVFLIGGALLGHSDDLRHSTRVFLEEVEKRYPGRYCSVTEVP